MTGRISDQLLHPSRHAGRRGFTLLEALLATVVLTMVAAAGAVGLGAAAVAQEEARIAQLAAQAAEQQVDYLFEQPYDGMSAHAVEEPIGQIKAPPAGGGVTRAAFLGGDWAGLGRRTTLTSEPITFSQYGGVTFQGTRVTVEVFGPDGTVYASVRRHRTQEDGS